MPAEPVTTIKVPRSLRERIARDAAEQGLTAAALLVSLLDTHERQARFRAVRDAYARPDAGYDQENQTWDAVVGDGLER